jgi:hypothetical protein
MPQGKNVIVPAIAPARANPQCFLFNVNSPATIAKMPIMAAKDAQPVYMMLMS